MKKYFFLTVLLLLILIGNTLAQTVYVTKSGKKYHIENCRYVNQNSHSLELSEAAEKGYTPCSVCKPPSAPGTEISEEKVQCSAFTKSGNRCKRKTKSPNGKCWQHGGN